MSIGSHRLSTFIVYYHLQIHIYSFRQRCADADILASASPDFASTSAFASEGISRQAASASADVCEWGEGHIC